MAQIIPFLGICPRSDIAGRVAALPYDVYNRQEAKEETKREPLSFLRIDRAETQFGDDVDTYDPSVYKKAHELLWKMIADGELQKENEKCYYIYELTMDGRIQTGLVACASVDDYVNGVIMKHENTRADKEQDRICHVDACNAQTGPIFLAYRHNDIIHQCLFLNKQEEPMFDFISPDGIRHRGWRISDKKSIEIIQKAFDEIDRIYIADGHHRAASAVKVSLKRRQEAVSSGECDSFHEYDYFLSVLFEHDELYIMDYNRVVSDLNNNSKEEFFHRISQICEIQPSREAVHPGKKGAVGMYLDGQWYRLVFKKEIRKDHPVDGLDVSILQNEILSPVLGIIDPKTDSRISFVGGIRGLDELERIVDLKGGVAFSMYPTSMDELFDVADAHLLMPPKSTWFEPKLRSGLFIHALQ
ncbi:MAG: DUF1015 family protein [Eubacteriales bacterium]|nr:DUF1015 family protein [Eubacteriales bacterium]